MRKNKNNRIRILPMAALIVLLVTIPLVLYTLYHARSAHAEWFNSAWSYRKSIRFGNTGSAVTDQKVLIAIDTATPIAAGKMQSGCQDVRFTDAGGKLLQYYINVSGGAGVGCNDASSDFYVLMPSIVAGNNLIYIYYGNPSALPGTVSANFGNTTFSPTSGPTQDAEEKSPGPVAMWKMDEGQGSTASDASGHGNSLTLTSTAWATQSATLSNRTQYLQFNGATSVASRANDTEFDFGTGSFSISAWIRHSSNITGTDVLITKYNTQGWKVYMNSSGFICFGIDDDSSYGPDDSACTTTSYADSTWHHIEVVKQGTTSITVYVDGIQKAQTTSLTATATLSTTATLYIGADSAGNTNWWDGWVDDVAIYPYARTANQIGLDVLGSSEASRSATLIGASASDPLANGLMGYWKMDDAATPSIDSSGNGNTGTWNGNVAAIQGKYGTATSFDGTGDYIDFGSASVVDNLPAISIGVWVMANNDSGRIIDKQLNDNTSGWRVEISSSGDIQFTVDYDGSSDLTVEANSNLAVGVWNHVAISWNGSSSTDGVKIFINGVLQTDLTVNTSGTGNRVDDSARNIGVGCRVSGANVCTSGRMDDMRLYNRALSPSEVRQLYTWAPGPVGWWKMDENTGNNAYDISGNNNTGTLTGPSWVQGKFGSAINFDGGASADDALTTGSDSSIDDIFYGGGTIETWLKPRSDGEGDNARILQQSNDTSNGWYLITTNQSGSSIQLEFKQYFSTTTATYSITTNALTVNTWSHVAVSYDSSSSSNTPKMYINGVNVNYTTTGSNTGTRSDGSSNTFGIGHNPGASTRVYDGSIDDVRIYNYARTPSQIVEDMNGGYLAPGSPVGSAVAHWKMDEAYGTTSYDSSIHNLHLTHSSASWTANGKYQNAWNGDGAKWLSITDANSADKLDFAAAEDFTISMWVKSDSPTNPVSTEYLLSKAESTAGYRMFVENDGTGTVSFGIDDDTSWTPGDKVNSVIDVYDGNWHNIVAVKHGVSKIQLYVDGTLKQEDTSIIETGTLENSITMYLGDRNGANGGDEFFGDLDEIKIFRSALTVDQIRLLYNQNQAITLGAISTNSDGVTATNSASREHCVPGDTTSCAPPVGWWKFDEKTGTVANDTSGNGMHASLLSSTWATGKFGASLETPVDTQHCAYVTDTTGSVLDITDAITVEAWINPAQTLSTTTRIADKDYRTTWFFGTRTSGTNNLSVWINNAERAFTSDNILPTNTWSHAVFTYNKDAGGTDEVKIYLNGTLVGSGDYSTAIGTNDNYLAIGANYACNNTVAGLKKIDNVKVYNYARTPAQIAWEYNRGAPVAYYTFNECQGSTVYNVARNADGKVAGMNGTITIGASGTYTSLGTCGSGTSTESWNAGTTGKYGSALGIDASNDYMAIPDTNALDFTTGMTVSGWIYSSVLPTTSVKDANIVNKYLTTGNQRSYKLMVDKADNKYYFLVDGDGASGSTATAVSDVTFTTGTWHHVVGVFQNSTAYIYVDGVLQSTSATQGFSTVFNSTADVVIGMDANKTSAPNSGLYDDVMLFNYPVTAAQVKMLYNQGSAVRFGQ